MAFDKQLLDALSVPLGDLIASVGRGIADAQRAMDAASIAAFREVYEADQGELLELQRIGYRPTWYHIPEAESQIQMAISVSGDGTGGAPVASAASRIKLYAAPIDAGYTSRFNFTLQASSSVKFRIVPVPPSSAAEALRVVPALVGLTLGEARARLDLLGVPATLPDAAATATITTQDPAPGTLLPSDGAVSVGTA